MFIVSWASSRKRPSIPYTSSGRLREPFSKAASSSYGHFFSCSEGVRLRELRLYKTSGAQSAVQASLLWPNISLTIFHFHLCPFCNTYKFSSGNLVVELTRSSLKVICTNAIPTVTCPCFTRSSNYLIYYSKTSRYLL